MLTQLEQRILDFIRQHIGEHEHSPTLTEIGAALGIKSKGTVHRYVHALIEKGELEQVQRGWRGIRLADGSSQSATLPLIGRIAAGQPIEAIPDQQELDLASLFAGQDRYALQVKGDSMMGVGILDGDTVILAGVAEGNTQAAMVDLEAMRRAVADWLAFLSDQGPGEQR